jgi:hypothetical protein
MNPCPDYESRILDYCELDVAVRAPLDAHLSTCCDCSQFLAALTEVDYALGSALPAGPELSRTVAVEVLRRAQCPPVRPTLWPELFDMVGWGSLIAVLFALTASLAPRGFQEAAVLAVFAFVIAAGSGWFVLEGWREFEKS